MIDDAVPRLPAPKRAARLRRTILRIDWMMVFPAFAAVAWVYGQDAVAMALVVVLPICLALNGLAARSPGRSDVQIHTGRSGRVVERAAFTELLGDVLATCDDHDLKTALLLVQIQDLPVAEGHWGADVGGQLMQLLTSRVTGAVRMHDGVYRQAEDVLAVVLSPTRRVDLDLVMQVVDRVQAAIDEGIPLGGRTIHVRSNVGLCACAVAPEREGEALLMAAECALRVARRSGVDAVRAFDPAMQTEIEMGHRLATQVGEALRNGDIRPWFQPQIDAATGAVVGLEALARWHHPELGVLAPDKLLPALASAGLSAELCEVILASTLAALRDWDADEIHVPSVGLNLSLEELGDPRLADRIVWQIDRHGLTPDRISAEILETVTLRGGNETVLRNIRTLKQAGIRLDLDDFGTGAASIAHIAEFGVHRIKIDRSFVSGVLENENRRRVIAAILGLAAQLDVASLAEGVETAAEQALLSQMGCGQLQGYGIAHPMTREDTTLWLRHRVSGRAQDLGEMTMRGRA